MATVDLTGQPLQTGFNPDSLVLERYAKDAEKLSQQAQPTADLARNLAQAATNARQMQMELSKLPEVIQGLSRSLREAFQQSIQGAREGVVSRGVTSAATTSPILTSAVTAAIVSQVARQPSIQREILRPLQTVSNISNIPVSPKVTAEQIAAREQATQGGKSLLDAINAAKSEEDIKKLALPGVGPAGQRKILEELQRRGTPFTSAAEVAQATGLKDPSTTKFQELTREIESRAREQETKPVTQRQITKANVQAETDALKQQLKEQKDRVSFGATKGGMGATFGQQFLGKQINVTESQQELQTLQAKNRVATDPKGVEVLRQEHRLRQDIQKQRITTEWNEMIATQGRFRSNIELTKTNLREMGITLRSIGSIGAYAFAGGTAGILSMVSAADPVAFKTFRGSMEYAAISIGTTLVPAVMKISEWIQNATDWFNSLDESTKTWISRAIIAIPVVGILGFAITKLTISVLAARTAMISFGIASRAATAIALLGPIGAIAVAVGGLAAVWALTRDRATEAEGAMSRASRTGVSGMSGARREVEALEESRKLPPDVRRAYETARTPEARTEVLQRFLEQSTRDVETRRREVGAAIAGPPGGPAADPGARRIFEGLITEIKRSTGEAPDERAVTAAATSAAVTFTERRLGRGALDTPAGGRMVAQITQALLEQERPRLRASEAAQTRLREAEGRVSTAQSLLRMLTGDAGGTSGGPRLDTRGLFPQAQFIKDFSQLGEQIAVKTIYPMGEQGVINELMQQTNMLRTMGFHLGAIVDNTSKTGLLNLLYRVGRHTP